MGEVIARFVCQCVRKRWLFSRPMSKGNITGAGFFAGSLALSCVARNYLGVDRATSEMSTFHQCPVTNNHNYVRENIQDNNFMCECMHYHPNNWDLHSIHQESRV